MIVGAGFGQLPAILTAREMGLKVVAIDKNPDALGMKYTDIALSIDVVGVDGNSTSGMKDPILSIL